ncbi:unnamed protein product [Vicia faba]|uniref:Uncharacterized protein n=1 Tax=Vicia faba TaxID=3906 RepID=A0AAV0Z332_VICFA|nr:unnamed protein product [Vicia faba]
MEKDPKGDFSKRLEGPQPCELSELKPGTHIFIVYGDNFFKTASYKIEAIDMQKKKQSVDELLKQRDGIHSTFTMVNPTVIIGSGSNLRNGPVTSNSYAHQEIHKNSIIPNIRSCSPV